MHDQRLVLEELYPGPRGGNNAESRGDEPNVVAGSSNSYSEPLAQGTGVGLSPQPLDLPHGTLNSNILPELPRWREESHPTTIVRAYEDGIPRRRRTVWTANHNLVDLLFQLRFNIMSDSDCCTSFRGQRGFRREGRGSRAGQSEVAEQRSLSGVL